MEGNTETDSPHIQSDIPKEKRAAGKIFCAVLL